MGKRFYPGAPHLLPPNKGVTDDPVGMTHWVVENGIRFSGMPMFHCKLTDNEIWQVSLLLSNADKLPAKARSLKMESNAVCNAQPSSVSPWLTEIA